MLGAENTYTDVEYMVEAFVSFCEQRFDYLVSFTSYTLFCLGFGFKITNFIFQYKWEISGFTIDQANWVRIPGHILRIPAGQLRGGGLHKISVSLLQSNDSSIIIYVSKSYTNKLSKNFTVMCERVAILG